MKLQAIVESKRHVTTISCHCRLRNGFYRKRFSRISYDRSENEIVLIGNIIETIYRLGGQCQHTFAIFSLEY